MAASQGARDSPPRLAPSGGLVVACAVILVFVVDREKDASLQHFHSQEEKVTVSQATAVSVLVQNGSFYIGKKSLDFRGG